MKQKFEFLFLVAILIMAVLCLFPIDSDGQVKNYNVWLLSSGDLIDFNSGEAMVGKTVDYKLNLNYDVLSLSDDEGNVALLGSATIKDDDGKIVWNPKAYVYGYFGVRDPSFPDSYYIMCSVVMGCTIAVILFVSIVYTKIIRVGLREPKL